MIYNIIQNNYACIIVCILFIGFVLTDRSFDRKIEAAFLTGMCVVLLLTIVDSLEIIEAGRSFPTFWRYLYSSIGYSLRPATALVIMFIMYRKRQTSIHIGLLILILSLFIANAVLAFISIFNHCIFGYSSNNIFYRGPLGMLPFITSGFYIVYMVVATIVSVKKRRLSESLIVFMVSILSVTGTLMESLAKFEATLNVSCAIGIFFYYLYLHVSIYSMDQLTGTFNRRIFFFDIEKLRDIEAYIVELDLNCLKVINDENGHIAGDMALQTMSDVIQKRTNRKFTLYRTGGDEFILLCRGVSLESVEKIMVLISNDMKKTVYSFAYGIAQYRKSQGIEMSIKEADEKMYEMKYLMKR